MTFNVGLALANATIAGVYDGSLERDRLRAFHEAAAIASDPAARHHAEVATRRARKDAERLARLERWARDRYLARKAALTATHGPGWHIIDRSHAELETLAHRVWDLGFHGIPFPTGWRVRWGRLTSRTPLGTTLGLADRASRTIVLDPAAHRTGRELLESLVHELVHVTHPGEAHGARFTETLARVLAFITPNELETVSMAPSPSTTVVTHGVTTSLPTIVVGRRWSPAGWVDAPNLDKDLEYRG
jgi:hypothetical protein